MTDFDLTGYKPERVTDNFEMMKGKGHTCQVNSSIIEDVPAGTNDRGSYEGYKRLRYELQVVSDEYKSRRVWKSYNLDSDEARGREGSEKTPREKLADVFFTLGLEFKNEAELREANGKFVNMKLKVSFSSIPAERSQSGNAVQLHTITGEAKEGNEEETKVAF